jgi:hypothetical protein
MIKKELEVIEIYPKILVYRNAFKDPEKNYKILKDSVDKNEDRVLGHWEQWSKFGEYINSTVLNFGKDFTVNNLELIETKTKKQEDEKSFILELVESFYTVTEDYLSRYGQEFSFNKDEELKTKRGDSVKLWEMYGPSICKYHKEITEPMSMTYHSDFIREPIHSPGYKFAITANAYFNDDYDGGEIDFFVSGELIKYKPIAGDWLVFPSGHPEVLRKDGTVYLHGVFPSSGQEKYFSRMYWRKYSEGSDEWFAKEQEFGKEQWALMQNDIMQEYNTNMLPNRSEIPEGIRVR